MLKELKLATSVSDLFNIRDAIQTFKCMNNLAAGYVVNMSQNLRSQIYRYNAKNNNNFNPAS